MGAPVKNLRDGTLTVQVDNDGGGNAGSVEVTLDAGDLTWTESRPVEMISDRGTLDHARRAVQDQLVELTFSLMYTDHLDPNSAVPTVYEALTRQGAAAAWVSQTQDSDDYAVNLEFVMTDPAGGNSEEINFDKFNVTSIDFAEGDPFNTLTVTGTAPLYWVDFWWRAADGMNPSIGAPGTFARAGTATYINSGGEVDYARSGAFRSAHHPAGGGGRTGLLEAQRSNIALMSEDMGGSDWTATNVTVASDSVVGPDGFTTADTLTASAGNGTLIQDLGVLGAVDYVFSIWLKRKTGVGDIDLTIDNGGSWTTVAVTSSWARYEITQSVANPDVGIRIVTNADAVYAWGGDAEAAAFASSYIPTTVYPLSQDGYIELSGAAGNYASTPDHARLDIVGDIDVRARIAPDDWTPAAGGSIMSKFGAAPEFSYLFSLIASGALQFFWSVDGTAISSETSSAVNTFVDGSVHWVRATMDVSSGDVNFYTSEDGENWTALGVTQTSGATSINSGTSLLNLGAWASGATDNFTGKVYRAQIYDGIAGTLVFDADPQDLTTHAATRITLTEKENSAVVTVFATSAAATRVADNLYFPLPEVINTPKEITAYAAFVEKGTTEIADAVVLQVGGGGAAAEYFLLKNAGGNVYRARHTSAAGNSISTLAGTVAIDDVVELRSPLAADGAAQIFQSLDGAAEETAAADVARAFDATWADETVYVNSLTASATGFNAFREIILTRRTRTLEHLRKVG